MRLFASRLVACAIGVIATVDVAFAKGSGDGVSIGMTIGMVVLILFGGLIGLSAVSKLLIVFGVVPKAPSHPIHFLAHALANFVGGFRAMRPSGERRESIARDPSRKSH